MDKDLNPREEAFCLEFAQSLDPKKAAKVAGYRSQIHGYTLLKNQRFRPKYKHLEKTESSAPKSQLTWLCVSCGR
jgi:hypothetical protein